jgi:multidrug efflux pump subunit AcrA (membrane-fusion protein)
MFVKIETIVAQKDSVIVIPKEIILSKRKGKTVYIVEKGAAQERIINTGIENADFVEIREGLKVGERLVTKGFETLHNRSKVKIVR